MTYKAKLLSAFSNKTIRIITLFWFLFNVLMFISTVIMLKDDYNIRKKDLDQTLLNLARQSASLVSTSMSFNKYSLLSLKESLKDKTISEPILNALKTYKELNPNTRFIAIANKKGQVLYSYPNGFKLPLDDSYQKVIISFTRQCLKSSTYCVVPSYNFNNNLIHLSTTPLNSNETLIKASPPIIISIKKTINIDYKSIVVGIIRQDGLMQANIPTKSIGIAQTGILAKLIKKYPNLEYANYEGYSSAYHKDKIGAFARIKHSNLVFFASVEKEEFIGKFLTEVFPILLIAITGSLVSISFLLFTIKRLEELERIRKRYEKGIEYLAYNDKLTHIPNRAFFDLRFSQMVASLNRENKKIALLILDLDEFKKINDTLGHDMGDKVLKKLSITLKSILRKQDTLARLGGDEFAILTDSFNSEKDLEKLSQRIISNVNNYFFTNNIELNLGISIGVAIANKPSTKEAIFKSADNALYESKGKGKNVYTIKKVI